MNRATIEIENDKGEFELQQKVFKTGSRGYWAGGKMEINKKRYQVSINVVEIGSKFG